MKKELAGILAFLDGFRTMHATMTIRATGIARKALRTLVYPAPLAGPITTLK